MSKIKHMDMFYKRPKGFTLLELTIVIVIILILAASTSTKWISSTGLNLDATAEQAMADLRYTQTLAMTRGVRTCLVGNATGNGYSVYLSNNTTPINFENGSPNVVFSGGIVFGTVTPGALMIVFDTLGRPYWSTTTPCSVANAAAATLETTNQTIQLTVGGITKTILMAPLTGSVSLQ